MSIRGSGLHCLYKNQDRYVFFAPNVWCNPPANDSGVVTKPFLIRLTLRVIHLLFFNRLSSFEHRFNLFAW
jgi:hypothetical protein